MNIKSDLAPVFLRVHTVIEGEKSKKRDQANRLSRWAQFALVFDCETTIDICQDLTFLWWRFCELKEGIYVSQREGVVYADDLDGSSIQLISKFARSLHADVEDGCPTDIKLQSRTEFIDGDFWEAIRSGAVIVCFNSPFDLSRLALEYRDAQSKNTGWSMVMWKYEGKPDSFKPKLRIKPKDSRAAFIGLAGGNPENRAVYRGRFLDLSVLGWVLRNKHMTLDKFLASFGLEGKIKHEPTGRVTNAELRYGRHDVKQTVALLNAMKKEYDGFQLQLPPERAMSPASLTKAFLDEMGIEQPRFKFDLSDKVLGCCMQAYYGGRSEIRIRHEEMPIVVCDTTSEYPSVAILLGLWKLLIAADLDVIECTDEARKILEETTLDTLLMPKKWPELTFFALTKPNRDILPVRSLYGDSGNTNIGVNPLTSQEPIWYAGPDLADSKLKSGRAPEITSAFRLVPRGIQEGMKSAVIGTREINPALDDLFQAIIEERKKLPKTHPHYLLLKILANALYGIFAELNRVDYGKNEAKTLKVFSGEHEFEQTSCVVERPGPWQFSPAAALITAGGRLMLGILESMVAKLGGTYLLTDTDSMFFVASEKERLIPCSGGQHKMENGRPAVRAITRKDIKTICSKMNQINPYDQNVVRELLKVEDCNFDVDGKPHELKGLAISAKRYVAFKRKKKNLQIVKPSEHGLGVVYVPDKRERYIPIDCKDQETSFPRWIVEAWERLLLSHVRKDENPDDIFVTDELWFEKLPAVMRVRVTTPNILKALRSRDVRAGKPYNFALSPILVKLIPDCTLIAPASKRPEEWANREYIEIHTGDRVNLFEKYRGKELIPQTISTILWRFYRHPEDKSLGSDGEPCNSLTRGLLKRRSIAAMTPFVFIGKEVERKVQEGEDASALQHGGPLRYQAGRTNKTHAVDSALILRARRFSLRELMRRSETSQHAVERFLRGAKVHPSTRTKLAFAIENLEFERTSQ